MNKKELRKKLILKRDSLDLSEKNYYDNDIFKRLINDPDFIAADMILIYVSFGSEINTRNVIEHCFNCGKYVAVPYCSGNKMQFFKITSFDDLSCVQFGIPTVDINKAEVVTDFSRALCVVPALSVDLSGYRLGYGGGYYDRFLHENHISSVCLCRNEFLCSELPHESHDFIVKKIITEN